MKKLLVMATMLFTVVSLAACNRSLDAFELLERSHEAQVGADLNSMTMEIEGQIGIKMEGMSMNMPLTMRFEMENEERMSMEMSMSMMGEEMNTRMFLRDGYEYSETSDFLGQSQRTRLVTDTAISTKMTEMIEGMFGENFLSITKEWIATSSAGRTDDGYRLELTYNIEDILSFLEDTMTEMTGIPGMEEFGDMDGLFDFDEEYLGEWEIKMVMYLDEDYFPINSTITVEGELSVSEMEVDMVLEFTMTMTVEDVIMDFPEWLDEIQEEATPNFVGNPVCTMDRFGEEFTITAQVEDGQVIATIVESRIDVSDLEAEELAEELGGTIDGDYLVISETEDENMPVNEFMEEMEMSGATCN